MKNLSWKNGFVSSIDGIVVADVGESRKVYCDRKEHQHQQQHDKPIQEKASTMDMNRASTVISRQPTTSILKTSTPCDLDNLSRPPSELGHRYSSTDAKSYSSEKQWPNNKENTTYDGSYTSAGRGLDTNSGSTGTRLSFEEEYQRKLQLLRSSALKKREDKLYVLLNRATGAITHVIRNNPKYMRK